MTAWRALVLGLAVGIAPASADVMPGDRLERALVTLDYERPWPGLDVWHGAASVGLPLGAGLCLGGRLESLEAGTVRQTGLGAWVRLRRRIFLAADRVDVRVDDLDTVRRIDVEVGAGLGSGVLSCGGWARIEGVGGETPAVWRQWWVRGEHAGLEASVGRRLTPWREAPEWSFGLRLVVASGIRAALGWRGHEAVLALQFASVASRVTATTVWSGVRAGGFGFRFEAPRP